MKVELSGIEREALTSDSNNQDKAHKDGAYEYLNSFHLAPRFGVISSYINSISCNSLLDIGCGVGHLRKYVNSQINYTGIDISDFAIQTAIETYNTFPNTTYLCNNFLTFKFEKKFDCIIWAGVGLGFANNQIVDLEKWRNVILKVIELLRSNAYLIIECIIEYKNYINEIIKGFSIVSSCEISCNFIETHPKRIIYILKLDNL